MCKACVCLNLTISWFLGLAFSSAFVAFSNSTSLHIRQKHISCRVRNSQNKCIRQLNLFIQGQQEEITNRENGFSKVGHWKYHNQLISVINGSRFNYYHKAFHHSSLCLKVFLSFFALQFKSEMQILSKGKQYKSAFSPDKHSLVLHGCIYFCL